VSAPFPIRQLAEERGLRVFRDECYPWTPKIDRDWFVELRGPGGILYGNDATSFWVDTTSGRAFRYDAIGAKSSMVSADGREARFLFDASRLDDVLAYLNPRKKRRLSPEQAKVAGERLAAFSRPPVQKPNPG
jgi:hypothetical protein